MQRGSFIPDDASGTGLDVYKTEHTSPPPGWSDGGQGEKEKPTVWNYYSRKAEHYDDDLIKDANNTVEVLLIFAGLFSAVVTAFISQTYPMLKPDPGDTLTAILQELQHPGSSPAVQPFTAPTYAVRVNCFLFAGLFISMIVALLSILVKQWARSYQRDLAGVSSPHLRARIRHFRYNGARRWHFTDIVGALSIFMHSALLVSGVGIIDLLLSTAPTVGYVALSIFLAGMTFFISTSIIPLLALDAPFRSPLSKLMTGIVGSIHRSTRKRKTDEEEGLEDHLEQSQGRESEENSIVRTQFRLDLDILSHILGEADKSTERWLIDLCFEKLPQLSLLQQRNPDLILRRKIIPEVYIFFSKGCITTNKSGEKEADPARLPRAQKLCEFLSWFLSLSQAPDIRDFLRQVLTAHNFDPRELPNALAQDDSNSTSITRAYSALGCVEHLLDEREGREPGPGCSACSTKHTELVRTLRTEDPNVITGQKRQVTAITAFLIQRTDCILCWEKPVEGHWSSKGTEKSMAQFDGEVKLLQKGFNECIPTDTNKKIWEKALKDKEVLGSDLMKTNWFNPLRKTLNDLQVQRALSAPWKNPASTTSSPAASRSPSNFPNNSRINHLRSPGTPSSDS